MNDKQCDEITPDPQAHNREQTRLRVQRHREKKAKQKAVVQAVESLATLDGSAKPTRARSKQALLAATLAEAGVTISRLVAKKVSALEATRFRQVGDNVREMPDHPTQLRACDALTKDLQMAGELPNDAQGGSVGPINVLVLTSENMHSPESLRRYHEAMRAATGQCVLTVETTETGSK